ncbi:MAG: WbqC family protein [Candidatus Hydrogenedentes bacterium]|nr:WbqC family protein [Candidatus Hydrogenedentota bacterium]
MTHRSEKGPATGTATTLAGSHQLHYLPWLRYFEKIARSDVFVVLDTIQYNKNGWQNRNKVKTQAGATILTVPVHASLGVCLSEVRIDTTTRWAGKHWATIQQSYCRCPFFADHAGFLEDTYSRSWSHLNALNRHMLAYFLGALGIATTVCYASELPVPGNATERLVNLLKAVGAGRYYTGAYALEQYLDANLLAEAGIELIIQKWSSPVYPQAHGIFIPDLSIIDLLMNCGPASLDILLGAAKGGTNA